MTQYLELLRKILSDGQRREDRTGVGTISLFGPQIEIDLRNGFPLLTTKKIHFKSIVYELLWFLSGSTNVKWLNRRGVTIWDEWQNIINGDLGPIYGEQWTRCLGARLGLLHGKPEFVTTNQIAELVKGLKENPWSRRHIVSAWNVSQINQMAIPPCHPLWQCYVERGDEHAHMLHLKLFMRSVDSFLGMPFNIASYALLLTMLAQVSAMRPGRLIMTFGDAHIYLNHIDQVNEQLNRKPGPLPRLLLNQTVTDIFGFIYEDFQIDGYSPAASIKAPIAV